MVVVDTYAAAMDGEYVLEAKVKVFDAELMALETRLLRVYENTLYEALSPSTKRLVPSCAKPQYFDVASTSLHFGDRIARDLINVYALVT